MSRNRGFTLVEVVVIILIVAALAWMLVPADITLSKSRARRAACMNHVRQIGLAMFYYASEHGNRFPPLVDVAGNEVPAVDNVTGRISALPSRSSFAVLMKEGYLSTAKLIVCPASGERLPGNLPTDAAFAALKDLLLPEANCSYGWDPTKRHDPSGAFAIVADKPPLDVTKGGPGSRKHNSPNHMDEGQNIFYADGHVKWSNDPAPDGDDIYLGGPGYEKSNTDAKIVR